MVRAVSSPCQLLSSNRPGGNRERQEGLTMVAIRKVNLPVAAKQPFTKLPVQAALGLFRDKVTDSKLALIEMIAGAALVYVIGNHCAENQEPLGDLDEAMVKAIKDVNPGKKDSTVRGYITTARRLYSGTNDIPGRLKSQGDGGVIATIRDAETVKDAHAALMAWLNSQTVKDQRVTSTLDRFKVWCGAAPSNTDKTTSDPVEAMADYVRNHVSGSKAKPIPAERQIKMMHAIPQTLGPSNLVELIMSSATKLAGVDADALDGVVQRLVAIRDAAIAKPASPDKATPVQIATAKRAAKAKIRTSAAIKSAAN